MAWNAAAPSPTAGRAPRPKRRRGAPALLLLLLAPAVSGCETMERMDYLDRFFEPASARPGAAVAAGEPVQTPADPVPPVDWDAQPSSPATTVVAMQPIASPGDRWSAAADRSGPQGAARAAGEPRPDPGTTPAAGGEARTRTLVRQNPWLTRFWMELTPAQRARVERQLNRGADVRLATERQPEPETVWDPMGLSDRASLVFGRGASPARPAPAEDPAGASASAGDF